MKIEELFEIIKEIELKLDLSKLKLFDIDTWPFIRIQLVSRINEKNRSGNINVYKQWERISEKLRQLPKVIIMLFMLVKNNNKQKKYFYQKCDVLFLTDSTYKRFKLEDGWYDVIIDPIKDYLTESNKSHFTLESTIHFSFKYPGYSKSYLIIMNMIYAFIKAVLIYPFVVITPQFKSEYRDYLNIVDYYGLKNIAIKINTLKLNFLFVHQLSKFFIKKIRILQPKIVIIVPYYGYRGIAMCYACNKLGIKVADIQHGVQGKLHPAYSSYYKIPTKGYNTLPTIFFEWSHEECRDINSIKINNNRIQAYCIGNLILNKFLTNNPLTTYFDKIISEKYPMEKKILITLLNYSIPKIYIELMMNTEFSCYYLIRLHPSTTSKYKRLIYNKLKKVPKNIYDIDFASKLPVHALLRNINLHITEISSTVIEASIFNVKSIIISEEGAKYYEEQIRKGDAFFSNNINDITKIIKSLLDNRSEKTTKRTKEINGIEVINRIIDQ